MEWPKLAWELLIVVVSASMGALARYAHAIRDQQGMLCGQCTINWRALFLEVPGVIACGLIAAGICYGLGLTHPIILAGAAAASGHVGLAVVLGLALRFLPAPPPRSGQDRSGPG